MGINIIRPQIFLPLLPSDGGTGTNITPTSGSIIFANSDGTYTQDNSNLFYDNINNKLGINTNNPEFVVDIDGSLIARGVYGAGDVLTSTGVGTRFFWYPRKYALYAGYVGGDGTRWDDINIGEGSAVLGGESGLVSGVDGAIVGGYWGTITGANSFIGGGYAGTITGTESGIIGGDSNSIITGYGNCILGGRDNLISSGMNSCVVGGRSNINAGNYSVIDGGYNNNISSEALYAFIFGGQNNIVSGESSAALASKYVNITSTANRTIAFAYNNTALTITQPNAFIIYGEGGYEKKVGIQTLTPSTTLDVNGTFKVASTATFNGSVIGINSDTSSIATSGAFATPYQPDTANAAFVTISIRSQISVAAGIAYIEVKSDSSATPTTVIATTGIESGLLNEDNTFTCSFFVKKGNYFQIDKTESNGTVTIKQWEVNSITIG